MSKTEPKKLALLRILQILNEHSDRKHPVLQEDISYYLEKDYGIEIERKAVGRNVALLKEAGIDIESGRKGSYIMTRDFEDSELHMLIDAVLSSKYITARHSEDLIRRLCGLSSEFFQSHVRHIDSVDDWGKTDNQELFLTIEAIDYAIENSRQIYYDYNKYGIDKKLHKTSEHHVSPYQMLLHNQRYYLMAYSEYLGNMVFHRLDHIKNIGISERSARDIRTIDGYSGGIDYKELASAMPYMFTDKPRRITFIADKVIIDQIIEWFGKDIMIEQMEDESRVRVLLNASPGAMEHWALQFLKHVEILEPLELREKIRKDLKEGVEKYK